MLVEIVDDSQGQAPTIIFPSENYLDLRANPRAINQIEPARRYAPLRNFLEAINSERSPFASGGVSAESGVDANSAGDACQFGSQIDLVFAVSALNFDRAQFVNFAFSLKELLERDASVAVSARLQIAPCDFQTEKRRGFYLRVDLAADGDSSEQAEMRWGLALLRVQQALLFRARTLRQTSLV